MLAVAVQVPRQKGHSRRGRGKGRRPTASFRGDTPGRLLGREVPVCAGVGASSVSNLPAVGPPLSASLAAQVFGQQGEGPPSRPHCTRSGLRVVHALVLSSSGLTGTQRRGVSVESL